MAERNPDGYGRVEQELAILLRRSHADRRSHRLTLTAGGRERLARARGARRRLVRQELSRWSTGDVAALGDLLARFSSSAEDGSTVRPAGPHDPSG